MKAADTVPGKEIVATLNKEVIKKLNALIAASNPNDFFAAKGGLISLVESVQSITGQRIQFEIKIERGNEK